MKKIKSIYVYHVLIWASIIIFKFTIDYFAIQQIPVWVNLQIFLMSIFFFYLNYGLVLPFLLKQNTNTRILFLALLIIFYLSIFFLGLPGDRPRPEIDTNFISKIPPNYKPIINPPPPPFEINERVRFSRLLTMVLTLSLTFSTILFFIDKWIENEKKIIALEFNKQSAELKILREQINPHFFFNALNSIYALSITNSKETPEVILMLSDIMRYVLNSKDKAKNNLNDEVVNINKYVEIQSIRFKKFNNINCNFEGDFSNFEIEPLLLLTFVENAFKYADLKKGPLNIRLSMINSELNLFIENHYDKRGRENNKEDNNKMGISNSKLKLDLLYPNHYSLNIKDVEEIYQVDLKLNLETE